VDIATNIIAVPDDGLDLEAKLAAMEMEYLLKALEKAGGRKKEAARLVNLTFRSFRYKLAKYGIKTDDKGDDVE
jgi:two-component system response regulator PilR (NtrC family)